MVWCPEQEAITLIIADPYICRQMASLTYYELVNKYNTKKSSSHIIYCNIWMLMKYSICLPSSPQLGS